MCTRLPQTSASQSRRLLGSFHSSTHSKYLPKRVISGVLGAGFAAAARATEYVAELFVGPGDHVESVVNVQPPARDPLAGKAVRARPLGGELILGVFAALLGVDEMVRAAVTPVPKAEAKAATKTTTAKEV